MFETGKLDLNDIGRRMHEDEFGAEDMAQIAQMLGYSLSGFLDLSYPSERVREDVNRVMWEQIEKHFPEHGSRS